MERSHAPLSAWSWGAYQLASAAERFTAAEFQRRLELSCYETAFDIVHELRVRMGRAVRGPIGTGDPTTDHVEVGALTLDGVTRRTRVRGRWRAVVCGGASTPSRIFATLGNFTHRVHHGFARQYLQAYLDEFAFRFNGRFFTSIPFCLLFDVPESTPSLAPALPSSSPREQEEGTQRWRPRPLDQEVELVMDAVDARLTADAATAGYGREDGEVRLLPVGPAIR